MAAVGLASIMLPFSVTGAAVVLPQLSGSLHASVTDAQWTLNTFNITFAALPLAAGTVADRIGRRRVLLLSIALVGLSSALLTLAPSMMLVNIARTVQGCGAAGVLAAGAAILAHATVGRQRQIAFGVLGTSFGTGLALGPMAAGALTQTLGWRSVFMLVAALSLPAWACATRAPESNNPDHPGLDWPGLLTFTASLTALSVAFVAAGAHGWTQPTTLASFGGAAALLIGFAWLELHQGPRAMFDVRLFGKPAFVAVVCQPFTVTLGFVILLVYLPAYLQGAGGRSVAESGLLLLPMTAPVLILPLIAAFIAARTSLRAVLTAASLLIAIGAAALTTLTDHGSWLLLAVPLLPFGIGVGLAFGVMDNAAVSTVPVANSGAAAGIFNTMRITGESLAVSAAAALLTTLTARHLRTSGIDARTIAGQAIQGRIDAANHMMTVDGVTHAFHAVGLLLAVLSTIGAILTYVALAPETTALDLDLGRDDGETRIRAIQGTQQRGQRVDSTADLHTRRARIPGHE
ncbi:MFS family permease [Mycolicibacterium fluoranthenivorans]|uniref:MFS family permease n=1 Tax=Mycolicibacterium fluoranthenivorans TaxID=258505 RepID=A0A7X5ZFP2_9MYCO|nr:MFS family permease [Mycolicibacterium fluoranthenivorans]